jgi:hypothetical protein
MHQENVVLCYLLNLKTARLRFQIEFDQVTPHRGFAQMFEHMACLR